MEAVYEICGRIGLWVILTGAVGTTASQGEERSSNPQRTEVKLSVTNNEMCPLHVAFHAVLYDF